MALPGYIGNKNQVLPTGRLTYGKDSAGDAYAILVDASGRLHTDAAKTVESELFTAQTVAASTFATSSILDLTGVKNTSIFVDIGRTGTAAFGVNGPICYLQTSQKAAGNDTWRTKAQYQAASTVCVAIAASADVAAGGTTVVSTSGTAISNLAGGEIVFWANTVSAASSEWMRVRVPTGTVSFTIIDGLTYAQDSDTNIFTQAEHAVFELNAQGDVRARVLINNRASSSTQQIYARVAAITER